MKNLQTKKPSTSIEYGQIFRVGNHLLACGDAKDKDLVDKLIGKTKIKAIISDPPYGIKLVELKQGFSKLKMPKKILNDDITSEAVYAKFTQDWLSPVVSKLANKNSCYIFNSDVMLFALRQGMEAAGVHFSQLLIWLKSQAVIGRKEYLPQHELLAYGWCGKHQALRTKDKSLIWCPKPSKSALHPSQKPVTLIRRLILNSTNIGDVIYDSFAGSGTLAVAAEQTKRSAILIERDEDYCRTILSRMDKIFGLKSEHINI